LPHKRQAKDREGYRTYYDDDLAELVSRYFRKDIETFAYTF
jgi:hypothetical protein